MQIAPEIKAAARIAVAAIEQLGGPVEAARQVGAPSYQSVQSWRGSGVPIKFCRKVHELTGIPLATLRPDDWADVWPELAEPTRAGEAAHG
ncbi:ABC transporter substrate-binding protein [Pulveribacter sp.]|uniref:ABC transporter substrate-binding protein n=1 Tax=Pulveribacter sp. TaxID=2678893 RepID=UPI00289A2195|nr:ABC transporter substrate-binding protein [Pulveribacter sp.]